MRTRLLTHRLLPSLLGLLLVALFLGAQVSHWPAVQQVVQRLELMAYDLRLNTVPLPAREASARIVIIDVDEASLRSDGRWPWPRDRIGELVNRLAEAGVAVVAFDVMFAEADRNPAREVLDHFADSADASLNAKLHAVADALNRDRQFAQALTEMDVVLGFALQNQDIASGALPPQVAKLAEHEQQRLTVIALPGYTANLPTLQNAARHAGFLNTTPDLDGVIRRSPLVIRHTDGLYASLALQSAALYQLLDSISLQTATIGDRLVVEHVQLGQQRLPTDARGRVLIPYRGKAGSFPTVSAGAVLRDSVDASQLENSIALVGTSAIGLADLKSTPVQNVFPGVEIQANILDGILNRGFPTRPAWADGADFFALLTVGLVLALLMPRLGPLILLAIGASVVTGWVLVNAWIWRQQGLVLNIALPVLMVLLLTTANMAWGFLFESRRRSQLKDLFGHYVPPQLVERMSLDPQQYHAEGESREMTVLFADIRSFTTISESLSANDLKDLLNRFFTPMTQVIFEHRGTIDKYVGDMIMAFWGAPLHDDQHAPHAIEAGLAMLDAVQRLRPELQSLGYPDVDIGIGINSGVMSVGDMGSEFRRAYTVLGDAVNLASRLEGLTKYYGVHMVVGAETGARAPAFAYRPLDRVRVKGKQQSVEVFEPLGAQAALSDSERAELDLWQGTLERFYAQQWDAAQRSLEALQKTYGARQLYNLYLERITILRQRELPVDWDGVFDRREK